jgi:GMP synthase (glutamine-hydrolysing)
VLREYMPAGTAPDADQLAEIEAVGRTIIGAFLG